jgi:hypothetical protein
MCRRLVRVIAKPGTVDVHLSDIFHEMRCTLRHDGRTVTDIEAATIRIPTSACPGAIRMLQDLVGTPLDATADWFYRKGRARSQCTHLYDLAVVAIRHAADKPHDYIYDAIVPDETDMPVWVSISRNNVSRHRWLIQDGVILEPGELRGNTLDIGFAKWATAKFTDPTDLEAATILSRTWLIAVGRRYEMLSVVGSTIADSTAMLDRCYAYNRDQATNARYSFNPSQHADDLSA